MGGVIEPFLVLAMPEKKKIAETPASVTAKRMSKPQASENSKSTSPKTASVAPGPKQLATFEGAMKLFHARRFKEAKEQFEQAASGPERDVAQRARLHIAMC